MEEKNSILSYGRKNFRPLIVTSILFIIYFIPYLGKTHFANDALFYMNSPGLNDTSLLVERQGAVLIRILFAGKKFSILYVAGISLIVYLLALTAFAFLFYRAAQIPALHSCIFFLLFMVHPIWIEQFYFTHQMFDFAVGVLLIPVILGLVYRSGRFYQLAAIPLMLILFSIYQSFIMTYIAGCILYFLLLYIYETYEEIARKRFYYLKLGINQLIIFLIAFGMHTIISRAFFNTVNRFPIKFSLKNGLQCMLWHIREVCIGKNGFPFYNRVFIISFVILFSALGYFLYKNQRRSDKAFFLLAALLFEITPFLMTVYMGTVPAYRAQIMLIFVCAGNFLLALKILSGIKQNITWSCKISATVCAVIICSLLYQYHTAARLEYTAFFVAEQDERRAAAIESAIMPMARKKGWTQAPIAFVGAWTASENSAFLYGESATTSMFPYAIYWSDPPYKQMTEWAVEYMRSLGMQVIPVSEEQIQIARQHALTMPIWPIEGSVQDAGDFIIVKLAPDDYYAEDMMVPHVVSKSFSYDIAYSNEQIGYAVDWIKVEDENLEVCGWAAQWGYDTSLTIPGVHLLDEENKILYTLTSGTQLRMDLSKYFADVTDYSHGGYLAKAPLSELPENMADCRIVLSVSNQEATLYADTGVYVSNYL